MPGEIRDIIGTDENIRSLGTGDPILAKEPYHRIIAEIEAQFASARSQLVPAQPKPLTKVMAKQFARTWFLDELQRAEDEAYASLGAGQVHFT